MPEYSFSGKKALVTGAGRGIGRALVKALVSHGAEVHALSRTQSNLDSLKAEQPEVNTVCVDLGDWDATKAAVEQIGDLDLLVNNAGVLRISTFLETSHGDIEDLFNVNVKGVVNVSQIVAKDMIKRRKAGSIVNVSSIAAMRALEKIGLYCASKSAVHMITQVMARELGQHKIRVNSVNPTIVMTEMGQMWGPEDVNAVIEKTPYGKLAEVDECVNAILFLLSDQAKIITGDSMVLDGGLLVA